MAGHSKWANIRFRKAAQDNKRGKAFTKLIKAISIAVKLNGAEKENNPRLRSAIKEALAENVTKDVINKAIKKASGADDAEQLFELNYEGYGPCGIALLVECLSDNKNRTVSEVRHAFSKCSGSLGAEGSVAYLFKQEGQIHFAEDIDNEILIEAAIEAGAEDIINNTVVITNADNFYEVLTKLNNKGLKEQTSEIVYIADNYIDVSNAEDVEKVSRLINLLESLDDVQNVHTNFNEI